MLMSSNTARPARLHYMANGFRVLVPGDHVVCAVSGEKIPLDALRYWSVARQEAYAIDEEPVSTRYTMDGRVRVIGADPVGSVYSGGTGRPYLVEGVGEGFWPTTYDRTVCDEIIAVSDADSFEMTRRLALTGKGLGIQLLDHLIVARAEMLSFRAQGLL